MQNVLSEALFELIFVVVNSGVTLGHHQVFGHGHEGLGVRVHRLSLRHAGCVPNIIALDVVPVVGHDQMLVSC